MKRTNPFSKGRLNRLVDDLVHPLFELNKGYILIDGVLHALVEKNPPVSMQKFVKYNLPELVKPMKQSKTLRIRRRSYNCTLPVNSRFIFCRYRKAGSWCLRAGAWGLGCPWVVISYRKVRW